MNMIHNKIILKLFISILNFNDLLIYEKQNTIYTINLFLL